MQKNRNLCKNLRKPFLSASSACEEKPDDNESDDNGEDETGFTDNPKRGDVYIAGYPNDFARS